MTGDFIYYISNLWCILCHFVVINLFDGNLNFKKASKSKRFCFIHLYKKYKNRILAINLLKPLFNSSVHGGLVVPGLVSADVCMLLGFIDKKA